jgi:hypothetical protein
MRCGLAICSAFAAASLSASSEAHAGAFAVRTQSAYGQGSSFAGIAAGGSLSSMFWNPANLSDVERIGTEVVASGIFPDVDVKLDPQPLLGFLGPTKVHRSARSSLRRMRHTGCTSASSSARRQRPVRSPPGDDLSFIKPARRQIRSSPQCEPGTAPR